jgi:hypothetical protein
VTAPSLLRSDSRPLLYAVAAIVAALAAIAFVLSFSALRDLAVTADVSVNMERPARSASRVGHPL